MLNRRIFHRRLGLPRILYQRKKKYKVDKVLIVLLLLLLLLLISRFACIQKLPTLKRLGHNLVYDLIRDSLEGQSIPGDEYELDLQVRLILENSMMELESQINASPPASTALTRLFTSR